MKRFNAMKAIKRLGVFAVAACVFLGGAKVAYAEEAVVSDAMGAVAVPPEGYEPEVLDEITVTETTQPMEASKDSGSHYNLSWSLANNTLTISGSGDMYEEWRSSNYPWATYAGEINKIIIGDYVTKISKGAFYNMDNLKTVTIGSRVTYIGDNAFYDCDNLVGITIPASVTGIGPAAFYSCANISEIKFAKGSKLNGIGYDVFRDCKNLFTITLPDSLDYIGESAFRGCSNLVSVEFGSKLKTLYNRTFQDCTQLLEVILPSSIRTIGEYTFAGCTNLVSVELPYGIQEIKRNAFGGCGNLTGEIKIPGTVSSLGQEIFYNCGNLKGVSIYASCKIPQSMFYNNVSLSKVTIGGTVTGIDSYAFQDCKALKEINIPKGVTFIGYKAFYNCNTLKKATFGENLTSIGEYAFSGTNIESIKLPNTVTSLARDSFANNPSLKTAVLSTGLSEIPRGLFYQCPALESVKLGNNVNVMGTYSFYGCKALKTINWPENLNSIYDYAFEECDSLTSVNLPPSVNHIGYRAFRSCDSLTSVVAMNNVTSIANYAFGDCLSLTTFKTFSTNTSYENSAFSKSPVTIYGWADSTAQTFAQKNNHAFVAITSLDTPVNKKIANVVSGAKVYWNAVPGASYYTVYRATTKDGDYKQIKAVVGGLNYLDESAVSGKTYYYKVEAKNGGAKSKLSAAQGITYVGTPDITSRINKAAGIQLGWNKITGATGYAIYRKSYSGNDAWVRVATISGNSTFTWTDESVKAKNGEAYKYTVRALAGSDKKTLSGCRNAGRTMVRLASRVLNSATKANATSIKCEWTTSSAVTGYEVRFMDGNKVVKTQTIGNYKTGTKTFTGLTKGKKYKVQVRSYKKVDGVGSFYSAWSAEKYVQL